MFRSFFWAGFEGSTGINAHRQRIDQVAATEHDLQVEGDYAQVCRLGLRTVRECVRWPLVERSGRYDFASLAPIIAAARKHRIEIVYDLFHFGYPDDVDPFSPAFVGRFAEYCYAVASFIKEEADGPYYFTPINEPSYFAWAAGDAGLFAPHEFGRGWELKRQLVAACIQGINAIRVVLPGARIINADPLCRVVAPPGREELAGEIEFFNRQVVFQSWDLLAGRLHPELGGSRAHLDIVGINYYWTNQWEWGSSRIPLRDEDARRWRLGRLIEQVWQRYGAEIVVSETSALGDKRAGWVHELTGEANSILAQGIPLLGVCLYPVLGMPEWHARDEWTPMGLWDLEPQDGRLARVPYQPMIQALDRAQKEIEATVPGHKFSLQKEQGG